MAKNKAAAELGKKGGKARAKHLTKQERVEIARKAGLASGKVRKRSPAGPTSGN